MKNASVKSTAEPTGKNDTNVSNLDSGALPSPFQMALSKQVQVKQVQAKSSQSKPAPQNNMESVKHALTSQTSAKQSRADQLADNMQNLVKYQVQGNRGGKDTVVDELIGEQIAEDIGNINLLQFESTVLAGADFNAKEFPVISEAPSDELENSEVDAGLLGLVAPLTIPMININPLAGTQMGEAKINVDASQDQPRLDGVVDNMFLPLSENGAQLKPDYDRALSRAFSPSQNGSTSENGAQLKSGSDGALSKALSPSQNGSAPESDAKINQGGASGVDGTRASDHTRWLDAMLPNTTKQNALVNEGDVFESKQLSNVIQTITESSLKAVTLPVNLQIATQVVSALPVQQTGSANMIASYPGKSGWDQAISQKVMWMVGAGEQSATLTLNPPDLGPLQVVIRVHNDQADTTFISDNAEVRQALENGLSNLRDKMSESGIQLGQANVSTGQQSQQEFQRATQNRSVASTNDNNDVASQLSLDNSKAQVHSVNGLVDTFA